MEAGGRGGSPKRQYYAAFAEAMGEEEVMMVEEEVGGVVVKKRRLTMEQVRYLESSFESENKLEPERKAHIAHKLGLQPRQVAVWFQNRRARSKSKQLERDFNALKADYHAVMLQNEKLQAEVQRLKEQLRERSVPQEEDRRDVETEVKQVKTSGSNVCSSNYVVGGVEMEAEAEVEASTASGGAERGNELGDGEEQNSPCAILADVSASVLAASGVPAAAAAVRAKVAVAESAASFEALLSEEIHLLTQQAYYAHHFDFYSDLNDNSLFVSYNPWSDD